MHQLAEEYKQGISIYEDYKIKIEELIKELLIENKISFHKIESRIKNPLKVDEKISRKNEKYDCLDDITDLVGIRIITYFDDEVDKAANAISSDFIIDNENSIDKRKLEIDRFGYKSLHYVVSLTKERQKLTEYKRFGVRKFEIQIRSILQHAWAEIEHDLGYKNNLSIPNELKRDFYRVAALLETADIEFLKIKEQLKRYELTITNTIKHKPQDVEINFASLKAYIESSKLVKSIDHSIEENTHIKITTAKPPSIETYIHRLYYLDVQTVKELDMLLLKYKDEIPLFAKPWLGNLNAHFAPGYSIFYLLYVIVASKNDIEFTEKYYSNFHTKNIKTVKLNSKRINDTYTKILKIKTS